MRTAGRRTEFPRLATAVARPTIDIALLGMGTIGSAVAELAGRSPAPWSSRIVGALVRSTERRRVPCDTHLTTDAGALLDLRPDVVVEVLGGIEPARTLVAAALERRIPVVTANKSLVAAHGDELLALAAERRTSLRYEASVLAGVPFLGPFGHRPHATQATAITGIVNGTSNFILDRMAHPGSSLDCALAEAQRLGFAEPDPRNDVLGIDAAEKLVILARHFGLGSFRPSAIETTSVAGLRTGDFAAARELGGVIKPLVHAARDGGEVRAFSGPAFLPARHPVARTHGVNNAITVTTACGDLVYAGPGAGPLATATTILDDAGEAMSGLGICAHVQPAAVAVLQPSTAWFVRLAANTLPPGEEIADLLGSYGIWTRRVLEFAADGTTIRYLLTYAAPRERVGAALSALEAACGCASSAIRALEG